jgi:hypothetical protein
MANRAFRWTPSGGNTVNSGPIDGTYILNGSIGGSKIITGDPANVGTAQSNGFFDNLGTYAMVALAGATAYGLWNKYGAGLFGSDDTEQGGGNDGIPNPFNTPYMRAEMIPVDGFFDPIQFADADTDINFLFDTTLPQFEPYQVAQNDGFDIFGSGWAEA